MMAAWCDTGLNDEVTFHMDYLVMDGQTEHMGTCESR